MPKPTWSNLLNELRKIFSVLVPTAAAFSCLTLFSFSGFFSDLISHFQLQYFAIGFCGLLVFYFAKKPVLFVLSIVAVLASSYLLFPYVFANSPEGEIGQTIRLAVFNVHTSNENYSEVRKLILNENAEFVVVLEIDDKWAAELEQLKDRYPHQHQISRKDNFGIAIFSQLPFSMVAVGSVNRFQPPIIVAKLDHGTRQTILYAVHPVPPASPGYFKLRNELLRDIAKMIKKSEVSSIVLGDLNTTMWTASYKEFLDSTDLVDPRLSFGLLPTWPRFLPVLYIPIEHILASQDIAVSSLKSVSIPGSDHRGLVAEVDIGYNPANEQQQVGVD